MPLTYATGVDGAVTLPTGYNFRVDFWSASFNQDIINITGFDSSGWREFRGGLKGGSGSGTGTAKFDAATTNPGFATISRSGASLVLTVAPGCTYTGSGIISNLDHRVDVNGANRINFDFVFTGAITVVWDEA